MLPWPSDCRCMWHVIGTGDPAKLTFARLEGGLPGMRYLWQGPAPNHTCIRPPVKWAPLVPPLCGPLPQNSRAPVLRRGGLQGLPLCPSWTLRLEWLVRLLLVR